MNYKAQLAQINATITAKQKQIGDIMTKSVAGGHTPSDEDESQITALEDDIARLEKNAERLQKLINRWKPPQILPKLVAKPQSKPMRLLLASQSQKRPKA